MKKKYTPEEADQAKARIDAMVTKGMPRRVAGTMKGHITRKTVGHESAFAKIRREHQEKMERRTRAQGSQLIGLRIKMLRLRGERAALMLQAYEGGVSISELASHYNVNETEVCRELLFALEARM